MRPVEDDDVIVTEVMPDPVGTDLVVPAIEIVPDPVRTTHAAQPAEVMPTPRTAPAIGVVPGAGVVPAAGGVPAARAVAATGVVATAPTVVAGAVHRAVRAVRGVRVDGRTNLGNRRAGMIAGGSGVMAVRCAGVRGGTGDEQEAGGQPPDTE
ncbi:MAG: hypothetical protein QOI74_658 [Micromonosporaceae bacterium]|nr:hypothetical protein [Micromonosporaceae bacterium]